MVNRADWIGFNFKVDGATLGDLVSGTEQRLEDLAQADMRRMARVHSNAAADIAVQYTKLLRDDIREGGFYAAARLSKTWHGRKYPDQDSIEPAIYFWNKAGTIVDAFSTGVTIHVRNRRYLAIPQGPAKAILRRFLTAVRNSNRDSGLGRNDEGHYEALGGPVAIVARALGVDHLDVRIDPRTGRGVIVAAGQRFTRSGRAGRGRGADTVLFVLSKQARLKARIRGRALVADLKKRFGPDFAAHVRADPEAEADTHAPTPLRGR